MARIDGVITWEGTRVAGATVPSCGSGFVLARAGKAPEAGAAASCMLQAMTKAAVSGLAGASGCAMTQPGNPVHTAARSNGAFVSAFIIVTSIETSL